jgi:hypothetical protein
MSLRQQIICVMVALSLLSLPACGGQTAEDAPSMPIVRVVSPPSGSRVAMGDQVEVQYRATDSVAVVRVELQADQRTVDSHSSPTSQGQPSLNGVLRWTPDTVGTHTLLVYAYNRDEVISDGARVEIIVSEAPTPEPTIVPATETPAEPQVTPVFSDDFSDPNSGWSTVDEDTYRVGYEGGEYFIGHVEQNDVSHWQTHPFQVFSDFTAEVQIRFDTQDDFVSGALIWRWQDNDNYYRFRILNTGQYDLVKRVDGEWLRLIAPTSSPYLNTGIATNTIKVVAVGDLIQLYANDQHLADFHDDSYARGRIGLFASVYTGSAISTGVFFDDLKVSAVGEIPAPPAAMTVPGYADDFEDPESGWATSSQDEYACGYEGGEYYIRQVEKTDSARWVSYPDQTFSEMTAEIQVRFDSDVERIGGGLIWRWQGNDNFYRLTIYNTGQYGVTKRVGDDWQTKLPTRDCPCVRAGIAVNTLRVVDSGGLIQIYINDQHVGDLADGSYGEGRVGVYTSVDSASPTTGGVYFDNLRVNVP